MLTISQPATTEAEAEAILDASYSLSHPFGIPTLIIDPADYHPALFEMLRQPGQTVENALKETIADFAVAHLQMPSRDARQYLATPNSQHMVIKIINKIDAALNQNALSAHAFQSNDPVFNIVICPRTCDAAARILKGSLCMKDEFIADMPGYDSQWNFFKLWHEFGHGLFGPPEQRAERAGACAYRHAFEDTAVLAAVADIRAAQSVLWYDKPSFLFKYGWPLVEEIDSVTDMTAPATWDDTVATAQHNQYKDPAIPALRFLGSRLRNHCERAFNNRDFDMLGLVCDQMVYKGFFEDDNQIRIAQRFAIAAQRLSIGARAYQTLPPSRAPGI